MREHLLNGILVHQVSDWYRSASSLKTPYVDAQARQRNPAISIREWDFAGQVTCPCSIRC
jgi:hypothetical protein